LKGADFSDRFILNVHSLLFMVLERRVWVDIEIYGFRDTVKFIREVFEADIKGNWHWFDYLDCRKDFARQPDSEMTLDKYLSIISQDSLKRMCVGKREYNRYNFSEGMMPTISLCVKTTDTADLEKSYFLWYFCPQNDATYDQVNGLFRKSYKKDINESIFSVAEYDW
jgi:hypothetical protein